MVCPVRPASMGRSVQYTRTGNKNVFPWHYTQGALIWADPLLFPAERYHVIGTRESALEQEKRITACFFITSAKKHHRKRYKGHESKSFTSAIRTTTNQHHNNHKNRTPSKCRTNRPLIYLIYFSI